MSLNLNFPVGPGVRRRISSFFRQNKGISRISVLRANWQVQIRRAIGAVALFLLASVVNALDVMPELIQLAGPHRARLETSLILFNDSPEPVDVHLEVGQEGNKDDAWIRVSPRRVRLKPGEKKPARIKVRVPNDGQGQRESQVRAISRGMGAPVEYRVIRRVNLRIAGTEKYEVTLGEVETEILPDQVVVSAVLKNSGNVSVIPVCEASLILDDGHQVTAYQKQGVKVVSPGERARVRVEVPLPKGRWTGSGVVVANYKDAGGHTHRVEKTVGD